MNPFTPAEVEMIRARYPIEGAIPLARAMGRRPDAIFSKASRMGLRRASARGPSGKVWTEAEDQVIREQWPRVYRKEKTAHQVADQLRLPVHQVRTRAMRLGVAVTKTQCREWSEEEVEYLMDHAHLGLYALVKRFKANGWPRSKAALAAKLLKLGCRTRGNNTEAYSSKGLSALLGVGEHPVRRWIKQGWLKAQARSPGVTEAGTPVEWLITPRDVRLFIENYTAHVDLSRADKYWLVDLLRGKLE